MFYFVSYLPCIMSTIKFIILLLGTHYAHPGMFEADINDEINIYMTIIKYSDFLI